MTLTLALQTPILDRRLSCVGKEVFIYMYIFTHMYIYAYLHVILKHAHNYIHIYNNINDIYICERDLFLFIQGHIPTDLTQQTLFKKRLQHRFMDAMY